MDTPVTGAVQLDVTEHGAGRPYLLLHGGGGPQTVTAFAALLAETAGVRVVTPTHPGFAGTARPERLDSVRGLAALYGALLEVLDLTEVTLVGNSLGGWVAAELALLQSPRVSRIVLLDAVGIDCPGHPVADFFSLTMEEMLKLSFHDPEAFRIDPTTLPVAARAAVPGNRASLAAYAGPGMQDPDLAGRLAAVKVPALVLWGESDRVADPDYGRAYAALLPNGRFELVPRAGHLPQIEAPQRVVAAIAATDPPGT